jgi:hypothetical protein
LYHRFLPVNATASSKTKILLSEFRDQLQAFYDAGYSLVPMEKWLDGDIQVPAGRRPMIFTMDDLFFADQVFINPDGTPSDRSGLGVLWNFSQEHPDFGFSAALFYNLGDKYYANQVYGNWFRFVGNWQADLAKAIIWCIEHDAIPYNHTYMHSRFDQVKPQDIHYVLDKNDREMRKLLISAHREDLIPRLRNYIALPGSVWPTSKSRIEILLDYQNPENQPVGAVMEAGYWHDQHVVLVAPFVAGFDRMHIPRIAVNTHAAVQYLVDHRDLFPVTFQCPLKLPSSASVEDQVAVKSALLKAVQSDDCPAGTYRVGQVFYKADENVVAWIWTVKGK